MAKISARNKNNNTIDKELFVKWLICMAVLWVIQLISYSVEWVPSPNLNTFFIVGIGLQIENQINSKTKQIAACLKLFSIVLDKVEKQSNEFKAWSQGE